MSKKVGYYTTSVICGCIKCGAELHLEDLKPGESPKATYDVVCSECGHKFVSMDRETEEGQEDTTEDIPVSLEEVKRKKAKDRLINQLRRSGYIE